MNMTCEFTSRAEVLPLQVESYWDECLALPAGMKDWEAYAEMKSQIQQHLDVLPLLHKLTSKVCFKCRNREFTVSRKRGFCWNFVLQQFGWNFSSNVNLSTRGPPVIDF